MYTENLHASLVVHRSGDLISVRFGHEEEVALFASGPAEVLLCSASAWDDFSRASEAPELEPNYGHQSDIGCLLGRLGLAIF